MSAVRRPLAVGVCLLFLARPAAALIPDPVESALLAKIAAVLETIERLRLRALEEHERRLRTRLHAYAFPTALFYPIRAATESVGDIRRELVNLACVWPHTPRTAVLEDMLVQRLELCRKDHHSVWGSHEGDWDESLQEAHDYVATMTANMISERTDETYATWVRAHHGLFELTASEALSPGEANRAEAAALAWANQVANGNSQIVTQHLLVRQMARDLERFDQKKADDLAFYAYAGVTTLAGRDWRTAPPDPASLVLPKPEQEEP
jgi:hypothetical protein